jgi:hypothetical protein
MAAGASKETYPDTLSNGPTLDIGAERVDATDRFVAGYARPVDRK